MDEFIVEASAADRHPAVVQGQEGLTGVKSVEIKRNIKKNSESEFVVTQSTRTEMLYDTAEQARDAYKDIHDAKEDAEFDDALAEEEKAQMKEDKPSNQGNITTENSWDADIIRQAASAYPMVADLGMAEVSMVPQLPQVGADPEHKGEYEQGAFDGRNGVTQPEHEDIMKPYAIASAEPSNWESSLLQPDFKVSPMEKELRNGVRREFEHTDDAGKAVEIALDHLAEDENYYEKLQQVMPEHGTEEKKEREVFVKPDSKEVTDYNYEDTGKGVMFPGVK